MNTSGTTTQNMSLVLVFIISKVRNQNNANFENTLDKS